MLDSFYWPISLSLYVQLSNDFFLSLFYSLDVTTEQLYILLTNIRRWTRLEVFYTSWRRTPQDAATHVSWTHTLPIFAGRRWLIRVEYHRTAIAVVRVTIVICVPICRANRCGPAVIFHGNTVGTPWTRCSSHLTIYKYTKSSGNWWAWQFVSMIVPYLWWSMKLGARDGPRSFQTTPVSADPQLNEPSMEQLGRSHEASTRPAWRPRPPDLTYNTHTIWKL